MSMRHPATGILCVMLCLLSGCSTLKNQGGFVQFYPGPVRPEAAVATFYGHNSYRNGSRANDMIRIVAINDVDLPGQFAVAEGANGVAVVPGLYRVKVLYVAGYVDVDFYRYDTLEIDARAGCRYDIAAMALVPEHRMAFRVLPSPANAAIKGSCEPELPPANPGGSQSG